MGITIEQQKVEYAWEKAIIDQSSALLGEGETGNASSTGKWKSHHCPDIHAHPGDHISPSSQTLGVNKEHKDARTSHDPAQIDLKITFAQSS